MMRCVTVVALTMVCASAVQAQNVQALPVPNRTIFPGESLKPSDFVKKLFNVNEGMRQAYAFDENQFDSMETARTLAAGKPVLLRSIRILEQVKKGQPTRAVYSVNAIEIQGTLVPLANGSVGQTVEARNTASGAIVHAVVQQDGTLQVISK
jgi:flagellar basal body P-ring formation protein FlgA